MGLRKPKAFIIIILGFIVILAWYFRSALLSTGFSLITAEEGWVKHEKTVRAVFANTETVLTAPIEGEVNPVQEEGGRFRKGETVAVITPAGVNTGGKLSPTAVSTPVSGLFYSRVDGLEQVITPDNLLRLDLFNLLTQVQNAGESMTLDGSHVSKYSPVGKIVNNLSPSWMFIYLEEADIPVNGSTGKFIIADEEYAGTFIRATDQPKGAVVRLTQYVQSSIDNRTQEITWIYKPATKGTIVPLEALCTLGEERGVYVLERGSPCFKSVTILDNNESLACVKGIDRGTQVISNPN